MLKGKSKLYGGILGCGLVALLGDRLFLTSSTPESASAAGPSSGENAVPEPRTSPAPNAVKAAVSSEAQGLVIPRKPFPKGVLTWDGRSEVRDLFSPHPDGASASAHNRRGPGAGDGDDSGRDALVRRHRLTAVLTQSEWSLAVISGRWMRIGDTLDGCRLTTMKGTSVILTCPDGEAVLSIDGATRTSGD